MTIRDFPALLRDEKRNETERWCSVARRCDQYHSEARIAAAVKREADQTPRAEWPPMPEDGSGKPKPVTTREIGDLLLGEHEDVTSCPSWIVRATDEGASDIVDLRCEISFTALAAWINRRMGFGGTDGQG